MNELVNGLAIACIVSFIVKYIAHFLFLVTLSEEDLAFLERKDTSIQGHKLRTITVILVGIHFFSGLFFFVNSAIIMAVLLRRFL